MLPAPFRHPAYRRYIAANFFGLNGSWMLRVSIAWLAWELTGSAAITGVVSFLTFAPIVFSGPFFGVLADRIDPKRGIVAAQSVQLLFGAILFALALADALSAPVLLTSALGMGLAASAYHPFRMALLPRLVPQDVLGQALAIGALNFNMTRMSGPALGGWLIHEYGAPGAVGVAAALFVPQILAIASLGAYPPAKSEPDPEARQGVRGVLDQLAEGARYAMSQPMVREAVLMNALFAVAARGSLELLPVAADGLYHRGAGGFGILTATAGAGAVVAAIYMARAGQSADSLRNRARFATALGLLGTALLGLVGSWPAAIVMVTLIGACGTMVGVSNQTIAQLSTPEGKRGRVMSLWLISGIGGASVGSIGIGALADLIGLQQALVVTAIAMASLAPFVAWNLRGRATPAEPPAPKPAAPGGGVGCPGAPTPGAVKRCANAPSRAKR